MIPRFEVAQTRPMPRTGTPSLFFREDTALDLRNRMRFKPVGSGSRFVRMPSIPVAPMDCEESSENLECREYALPDKGKTLSPEMRFIS